MTWDMGRLTFDMKRLSQCQMSNIPCPMSYLFVITLNGALLARGLNFVVIQTDNGPENFFRVLAQQGGAPSIRWRIRQFDRVANSQILSAFRVVNLYYRPGLPKGWLLGDLFHREDRTAGYVLLIKNVHDLHLCLGHGPLFDFCKHEIQLGQARFRCVELRILQPVLVTDDPGQRRKGLRLGNDIVVSVRLGFPALAADNTTGVTSSGGVTRSRRCVAEFAVGVLRILFERAMSESLLVPKLHTAEIQHGILHGASHALSPAALLAMKQGSQNAGDQMDAGSGIADLGTGHHRETTNLARSRG